MQCYLQCFPSSALTWIFKKRKNLSNISNQQFTANSIQQFKYYKLTTDKNLLLRFVKVDCSNNI